ncbi:MAG: hypothetical protein KAH23_07415 [Kiritimatiellae bacterium]|nr:hypothetical protein [Kiritimatiellia bacterium]
MNTDEHIITPAYLWFDTEFTGLDLDNARLLQVALFVTDANLNRKNTPDMDINLCIRLEPDAQISDWVEQNLADLLAQCRSTEAVTVIEADRRLAKLVDETVGTRSDITLRPVLAGNTVHMDMALVRKFLPQFSECLHYRLLDVSSLKLLWNDWLHEKPFEKDNAETISRFLPDSFTLPSSTAHDAYFDIHASLAELNYYRTSKTFSVA